MTRVPMNYLKDTVIRWLYFCWGYNRKVPLNFTQKQVNVTQLKQFDEKLIFFVT